MPLTYAQLRQGVCVALVNDKSICPVMLAQVACSAALKHPKSLTYVKPRLQVCVVLIIIDRFCFFWQHVEYHSICQQPASSFETPEVTNPCTVRMDIHTLNGISKSSTMPHDQDTARSCVFILGFHASVVRLCPSVLADVQVTNTCTQC